MVQPVVIVGSVLLVGNMLLAASIHRINPPQRPIGNAHDPYRLHQGIAGILESKGLEPEVASTKAAALFAKPGFSAARVRGVQQCLGVDEATLHAYFADRALFGKPVDLASYDTLVRMAHTLHQSPPTPQLRENLRRFAEESRSRSV